MNINKKVQLIIYVISFLVIICLPINSAYAVKASSACKDVQNKFQDECKKYVNTYNDCNGDTDCEKKAYKQYKNSVCNGNNACESNENKVIAILALGGSGNDSDGKIPNEAEAQAYSCDGKTKEDCLAQNPIVKWINYGINLLTGIVGVGAVLMLIVAGIQYITARDNAQNVAAAKQKIINVVIGLAAFIFLYAFLQWLIPGGAFK